MKHSDTRENNRKTVKQYMETLGQARLSRHELFDDEGYGGLWTTDTGEPVVTKTKKRLGEHAVWSLACFPDWQWYNVQIFDTQDPDIFWVECDGKGEINFKGYPKGYYENHFIHYFQFKNGKIIVQKEFMNPCEQFRALGIPVPKIIREGIPT
ncbi:PhzA/PhzB family protein [Pectobacterium actinidiae]|uniref:PhzA/PhzB family protein n=1 Tax=Pectobacterium actinidiae TaxID=1507808 RepID=UPI0038233083